MIQGRTETLMIRVVSATFVVVALAVFKPFGLDAWQWQAYTHLAAIWAIGIMVCMVTDVILKYIVRMPRSYHQGVSYIIRRNLWFQLINTPLIALSICLYRHFVLSHRVEGNQLSIVNFLETLVIIAFCSFAIGLYWRFKFRSRYLAAELEETRLLNEQLKQKTMDGLRVGERSSVMDDTSAQHLSTNGAQESSGDLSKTHRPQTEVIFSNHANMMARATSKVLTLTGTTNESVTLNIADLMYIEAVGNYMKVYQLCSDGTVRNDMIRATSKQMEDELSPYPMIVRCHRAFLVNLGQVEKIVSNSRAMQLLIKHSHDSIPVSRSNWAQVKEAIKHNL